MFLQLGVLSLLVLLAHGKAIYDQRQDGNTNVHAQLDNLMFVIAFPSDIGTSSLINSISSQIMEMRGLASRNKKISIANEEITEEGKDPLNVKILRIESDAAQENQKSAELPAKTLSETLKSPKIQDIKIHIDENQLPKDVSTISDKKASENLQVLEKLKVLMKMTKSDTIPSPQGEKINLHEGEKIHSHQDEKIHSQQDEKANLKEIKDLKIIGEKIIPEAAQEKDLPKKEKIPEKLISFGTISSVDGKVIYNMESSHSGTLEENQSNNQEKIVSGKNIDQIALDHKIVKLQEKAFESHEKSQESKKEEIAHVKEKIAEIPKIEETISKADQEKQILIKTIGLAEGHKIVLPSEEQIERKTIPKSRRVARELQILLRDPIYSKGRTSLKKELPKIDDFKDDEAGDKNEVRLIADQKSHLKPIGDMLENCGPGRIRNRYGICQFDESFN